MTERIERERTPEDRKVQSLAYIGNALDGILGDLHDAKLMNDIAYDGKDTDDVKDDHVILAQLLVEAFDGDTDKARDFVDSLWDKQDPNGFGGDISPDKVFELLKNKLGDQVQWTAV